MTTTCRYTAYGAIALIGGWACLAGCTSETEASAASLTPERRLELVLRTTVDGNQHAIGRIGGIVAGSGGQIYLTDVPANEVVSIKPDGSAAATIGSEGSGPGEFRGLRETLAWLDGRVHAFDWRNQRVTVFNPNGSVAGTLPWPGGRYAGSYLLVGGDHLYGREVIYPPRSEPEAPPGPLQRQFSKLERTGPERLAGILDTIPWPGVDCSSADGQWIHPLRLPFESWFPQEAFLPSGKVAIARTDSFVIDIRNPSTGMSVGQIRRRLPAVALTDERWELLPEIQELARLETEGGGRLSLAQHPDTPCPFAKPNALPAIRAIVSDEEGKLWVEAPAPIGFALNVFASDGELLGEAPMPVRDASVPFYVSENMLYVVTIDSLDVQSIHVYEVLGLD